MTSKLKDLRILLIDDDEFIRDSMSLFFQCEGYHFTALENAEEGLEVLKKEKYDIVFSDYMLPGINGLEFLKFVNETHPNIIKVFITAYFTSDVFYEAINIGVEDFIQKPYTISIIERSLTHLLEKHKVKSSDLYMNGEKISRINEVLRS